MFLLHSL